MSSDIEPLAAAILNTLLDRFEQPARQTVVRVRLNKHEHPDYFSQTDAGPRRDTNRTFEQLAQNGLLVLHWVKWERGNWLEAVDLVADQAHALYFHLGRAPRSTLAESLATMLAFETGRAAWHTSFLRWAQEQLALHKSVAPLKLDEPHWNRDLLRALAAIAQNTQPVLERSLSVRLFSDSKRFEHLRGSIISVTRRHDPEAASYGDDHGALLRAYNIERAPEYVPVAGPLVLALTEPPHTVLDLGPLHPSIALPAPMLRSVTIAGCSARVVLTVENGTSFSEFIAVRPPDVFVVYIGGFASPTVISLLHKVRAVRPSIPLLHWGDLDAGGLRILAHLRRHLHTVSSIAMDPHTLHEYYEQTQPLTAGDKSALTQLRSLPALADCVPLIDALLERGQKLEQEAIGVDKIINAIETFRVQPYTNDVP